MQNTQQQHPHVILGNNESERRRALLEELLSPKAAHLLVFGTLDYAEPPALEAIFTDLDWAQGEADLSSALERSTVVLVGHEVAAVNAFAAEHAADPFLADYLHGGGILLCVDPGGTLTYLCPFAHEWLNKKVRDAFPGALLRPELKPLAKDGERIAWSHETTADLSQRNPALFDLNEEEPTLLDPTQTIPNSENPTPGESLYLAMLQRQHQRLRDENQLHEECWEIVHKVLEQLQHAPSHRLEIVATDDIAAVLRDGCRSQTDSQKRGV